MDASSEDVIIINPAQQNENEQTQKLKNKKKDKSVDGRPLGTIWLHFERKETVALGKFGAKCKYCSAVWKRKETPVLEEHLANHCSNVPALILREYMTKVMERETTFNKKRKLNTRSDGQTFMKDFHDSSELPESRINRINRALTKFFVACGVSFRIVEHPFFIDFVKELNAGYDLPTRDYLSSRLLENELCHVNSNIQADLDKQTNLTLGKYGIIFIIWIVF